MKLNIDIEGAIREIEFPDDATPQEIDEIVNLESTTMPTTEDIAPKFTPAIAESTKQKTPQFYEAAPEEPVPPQTSEGMPLLPMTEQGQQEYSQWEQGRKPQEQQVSEALAPTYTQKAQEIKGPPQTSRVKAVVGGALPEFLPEKMRFPESQAAHPGFAVAGKIESNLAQILAGGIAISKLPAFASALSSAKAIKSTPLRIAAVKGLQALQRGIAGGTVSAAEQYASAIKGKQSFENASKNVSTMVAANVLSVLPQPL